MTSRPVELRWKEHIRRHKRDQDKILYRAMREYGVENFIFEVVHVSETKESAVKREQYLIDVLGTLASEGKGYNVTAGGEGTVGLARYGSDNPFYGRTHSEETRKLLSEAAKQRICTDAARNAMRRAQLGRIWSESHRANAELGRRKANFRISFPDGTIEDVNNLSRFARENGLQQSELSRCAAGKIRQHKGFVVVRL